MSSLVGIFADAGCENVRTYIQSGNLLFRASKEFTNHVPSAVARAITDRMGLRVPIVTRSIDMLRALTGSNPFIAAGVDPTKLHVAFLADKPSKVRVAALDPDRSPPDEFIVRGSEIFLHCPNGIARTKLTNNYLDSKLEMTSTIRNWTTMLKLLELGEGL